MPVFRVFSSHDEHANTFWVEATTAMAARRFVALNIAEAAEARDLGQFRCVFDKTNPPRTGHINRRLGEPIAITKR
jgi:hypothetical protein